MTSRLDRECSLADGGRLGLECDEANMPQQAMLTTGTLQRDTPSSPLLSAEKDRLQQGKVNLMQQQGTGQAATAAALRQPIQHVGFSPRAYKPRRKATEKPQVSLCPDEFRCL
jgi:hypothetical protein